MANFQHAHGTRSRYITVAKLKPGMVIKKAGKAQMVVMGTCTLNLSPGGRVQKSCGIVAFQFSIESIVTDQWRFSDTVEVFDVECPIAHEYRLINLKAEGQMSLVSCSGPSPLLRNDLYLPKHDVGSKIKEHWDNRRDNTYQHLEFEAKRTDHVSVLPAELLLEITQYLRIPDIVALRATCKRMTVLVEQPIAITTLECCGRVRIIKVKYAGARRQFHDTMSEVG